MERTKAVKLTLNEISATVYAITRSRDALGAYAEKAKAKLSRAERELLEEFAVEQQIEQCQSSSEPSCR